MTKHTELFDQHYVKYLSNDLAALRKDVQDLKSQLESEKKKTETLLNLQKLENQTTRESGMQFLRSQIDAAVKRDKQFFTESGSVTVPDDVKYVIVTACGSGAAGYHAVVDGDSIIAGCGGGSGASVSFYPIQMNKSRVIKFSVGKGGIKPAQDGQDTVITYENQELKLGGGKGCKDPHHSTGGSGGICDMDASCNGCAGEAGTETLYDKKSKDTEPALGGSGGSSRFSRGGIGGLKSYVLDKDNKLVPSLKGGDGFFGAGGGGSSANLSRDLVGFGGSGFVYLQFV